MSRRWFKNQAGTESTVLRIDVALLREDFDFVSRKASEEGKTLNEYLYHLCRSAIDQESQKEYDESRVPRMPRNRMEA